MLNNIFSQVKANFISDMRIYNVYRKYVYHEMSVEIKTTTTAVIKNELKYFPMPEGNTCIAEPNLEVLPLICFSKGPV